MIWSGERGEQILRYSAVGATLTIKRIFARYSCELAFVKNFLRAVVTAGNTEVVNHTAAHEPLQLRIRASAIPP
jgi:hypothetical protein